MMIYKIAIVGATGVVGRTALNVMEERGLTDHEIVLFASHKSKGKIVKCGKTKFHVRELDDTIYDEKLDFALFCTKENLSGKYIKELAKKGTKIVDFSALFRKKHPLIVPEVNGDQIHGNIICNPNCSTIGAIMALYQIHKNFGIKRIVYSTYQAVSGAGKKALDDLKMKRVKHLEGFMYPIYNNIIPYIGEIDEHGYSKEENKMMYETRKILKDKNIKITSTCIRVPIDICHSESINFETVKKTNLNQIKKTLKETVGVEVCDTYPHFPMPIDVRGQDKVFVGRIRKDMSHKNSYNIFVVSDNLRKGAAQNGVQILQMLIKQKEEK